jgi:hypothetical protein
MSAIADPVVPKPNGQVVTTKDEIFHLIEGCELKRDGKQSGVSVLRVACADKCIEDRINAWLAENKTNPEKFMTESNVYEIERLASLNSCRTGKQIQELAKCGGQFAPDIISKFGDRTCLPAVNCVVKFDVDGTGKPVNEVASCDTLVARKEFEREAKCLVRTMSYSAYAGRKSISQPFEMVLGPDCPIS